MPKRKVQFVKGHYYHIYNRGAGQQSIFRQERDYVTLLFKLKEVLAHCQVTMIAYCLMPNHYHWLVRQDGDIAVREVPKRVFGSYSQTFNLRYQRSGTLFEGPYEAILVDSDEYLCHLCRYIHLNPVKHAIAMSPELWSYSNYLDWLGRRQGSLVEHSFIQAYFPLTGQYEAFVQSSLKGQVQMPYGVQKRLAQLTV